MRTTLNLPDALMARLRSHARERGETVTSVVERAMREALDAADHRTYESDDDLPDYPVLGEPAGTPVDLDPDLLFDVLYGPDPEGSSEQRLAAQIRRDLQRLHDASTGP